MEVLKQLNLNLLRVFTSVYRHSSMSLAARELHLTQPGVSQHIKHLEAELGIKLFDRVKNRLVPSTDARLLFRECETTLSRMESLIAGFKSQQGMIVGEVYLGMPIEFGNNQIMPLLCAFSNEYPHVRFHIKYDFASVMNRELLDGNLDFAFVDEYQLDPKISTTAVKTETLELCCHEKWLTKTSKGGVNLEFLETLPYVEYQDEAVLLRRWFRHHFGVQKPALAIKAHVMDVQGVIRMIEGGMGAGIIPGFLFDEIQKRKSPVVKVKGKKGPLQNSMSVAVLKDRELSFAAQALLKFLKSKLS